MKSNISLLFSLLCTTSAITAAAAAFPPPGSSNAADDDSENGIKVANAIEPKLNVNKQDDTQWTIFQSRCWKDAINGVRALDHAAENFDASYTTPRRCRGACASQGYVLAAVEYGHECWCGNTIAGRAHPVSEEHCDLPCSGDQWQTCGGYGFMNLFVQRGCEYVALQHRSVVEGGDGNRSSSIALVREGWYMVDCFRDVDATHRLLPFQPEGGQPERLRTVDGCIQTCRGHGYTVAGVEYGKECYCGFEIPPWDLVGGVCDMACKGDGRQTCGGEHSLLVYAHPGHSHRRRPDRPDDQEVNNEMGNSVVDKQSHILG